MNADETARRAARELATDLVVRAGAGTGKTHTLVEAMVHLASGTTALGRTIPPSRVLVLTFSEKATGELRERIRERLRDLGQGTRDALVATFHGFAASLLRRHAAVAGVDPDFQVLAEPEAALLGRQAAEETVLASLDVPEIRELVVELDFSRGPGGRGLVEHLLELSASLAEEGRSPASLVIDDASAARALFLRAKVEYAHALDLLLVALVPQGKKTSPGVKERFAELSRLEPLVRAALAGLDGSRDPAEHPPFAEIDLLLRKNLGTPERNAAKESLGLALGALGEAHTTLRAARLGQAFCTLLRRMLARYGDAKRERGAMDFGDLVLGAHALLDDPDVRAETQARFDAILVDEFQDTNELQDELVQRLRGERTRLLIVGDPKQSIYEFRGADVSVFGRVAQAIVGSGGQSLALTVSRRGRAPLVEFQNRLFARTLTGGARAFEIAFDPEKDSLLPHRGGEEPCVEILLSKDKASEPAVVARHLRALVDQERPLVDDEAGPRALRFGDMALLLRRFTHLETYLAELRRAGVPHYVVHGRGFYEAQEIRDLAHALTLCCEPEDSLALLGVLRSPLVCLSDASLVTLAELPPPTASGKPGALALLPLLAANLQGLPAHEAERLALFLRVLDRLGEHGERLGAYGSLRALIETTDLLPILASTLYGAEKVANVEELCRLARAHDRSGRGLFGFVRHLRLESRRETSRAPAAQALGEKDDVVRVMTVHQSKGLEFPVVILPDLGARERAPQGNVVYDRAVGLGFKLLAANSRRVPSTQGRRASELLGARTQAESLRLFYVAATRAKDWLVLSCPQEPVRGGRTWQRCVDELLSEDPAAQALTTTAKAPSPAPPCATLPPADALPALWEGAAIPLEPGSGDPGIDRALAAPALAPESLILPLTELIDFSTCPERYRLRHEVGLAERPLPHAARGETGPPGARDRGTLAHRLLERIDWPGVHARGAAALDELLLVEGYAASTPLPADVKAVREAVLRFLECPFGVALAGRPPEKILREVPFAFALPRVLIKGKMDLVLLGDDEDDDTVTVLDYKLGQETDTHRMQLAAYAAAARTLFAKDTPRRVRAGLVFLGAMSPTPQIDEVSAAAMDACERKLAALAEELLKARAQGTFAERAITECHDLRCGYITRCHGDAAITAR